MASTEHIEKKARTTELIGTHSGTFHCDEALAVYMLKVLPQYKGAEVVRSRDLAVLEKCSIVVDVGGVYDAAAHRYDHHQRGFFEVFGDEWKTKLSSAGLVYKHFGIDIIATHLSLAPTDPTVQKLFVKLYEDFVEAIDGIDNGVTQFVSAEPARYKSRTDLSARVGALNPRWNEKSDDSVLDTKFVAASALTGSEFIARLDYLYEAWLPARQIIVDAFNDRLNVDPSGQVLVFDSFAPWKEHMFEVEAEAGLTAEQKPLYVLYPEESGRAWRIQAIPESADSFASRKAMPEPWRGVRDGDLSTVTGIPGCVFCHAAGFIGGNATKAGALEMAKQALATPKPVSA